MSIIINSNLATAQSSLSLKRASERLSKSLQRVSSGNRIVTPSEDAGGLAVAMKLESSLRRANATMNNTQNGMSFLQMQDGALKVAGEIVDRMSELKSFYNDVSKNADDRENYNHEFRELQKELVSLKAQKFNGVSLFATDPASAGINIMTSDDGLGDPIELSRTGLFENFKSKFGADGKLNTGSSGSYRQLVGEFSIDGGTYDSNPGYSSKDYKEGEVVYRAATTEAESGYFMALRDVPAGSRIKDSMDLTSNWIRVADKNGQGFSEAFPEAPAYNMNNLQFNSKGEAVSYLEGDVIKVQSHWDDPNSFVFLKAINDVPQNILIDQLLINGIGTGKYFDFVGKNGTDGKPTSQFGGPNSKYSSPMSYNSSAAERKTSLRKTIEQSEGNNFTPGYVEDENGIYRPLLSDWNLKFWSEGSSNYEPGDLLYNPGSETDNEFLFQVSDKVKGRFAPGNYDQGELVFSNGKWFMAEASGYSEQFDGELFLRRDDLIKNQFPSDSTNLVNGGAYTATDNDPENGINAGDWYQISAHENNLSLVAEEGDTLKSLIESEYSNNNLDRLSNNTIFQVKNVDESYSFYKIVSDLNITKDEISEVVTWANEDAVVSLSFSELVAENYAVNSISVGENQYSINELVNPGESPDVDENEFWIKWSEVTTPLSAETGFAANVTDQYADLSNEEVWNKTYYGSLNGITVGEDYERGDNIFYEGKHYIYVSHLPSSDESFSGEDGLNDFEQLLLNGAIKELGIHVETTGAGGASDKAQNSFYKADSDLEFVDRLAGSGLVRTSGAARMGDPMQNGDGVFNSIDDQIYNELNPGNDGIFGTMDDFYSATPYQSVATKAGHIDSDADNNKDLLDLSNDLGDFSVADFVDYTQTVANFRAINGGTMSRINFANRILEENKINLESARGRIMDTDISLEASKMARQNVIMQASAAMVTQANQMQQIVLQLLQ